MKRYFLTALALLTLAGLAIAAAPGYKVLSKLKIGGAGGWDYVFVDSDAQRLYVSHTNQVEVVDMKTMMLTGKIENTTGVHGIAIAPDLNRGYTSNGRDNSVTIFDTKTLATISKTPVGMNPDSIIYEPSSKRVYTFNGRSADATAIDAKTGMVVGTVPLGQKPEFSQTDGKGKIWVNLEPTHEIVEIDAAKATINKKYSIEPCEEPSGLARDPKSGSLFSVCGNKMMIVSDPATGKVLANLVIGAGADGVAFDNGMAFSSNGGDGTITVVGQEGGKWTILETAQSQRTGRTIGVDPKTHHLFIPAAESTPGVMKDGKQGRPQVTPDSFTIFVVGK
ncbi:MAG: YncE family protein [Acidobacteriota bacterium]